ncbi:MAG: cysteine desulfurase family protein [Phycisphaerales bacterium]|nr:cysteine desulfurase [Planctomycetota bacterium]
MIYLDNNATTRPCPGAIAAAHFAMEEAWQNPSSTHRPGQQTRAKIEMARRSIAELVGCLPREVLFTSSGTEAIHLAIRGVLGARPRTDPPPLVVSSPVEHSAVRELLPELEARGEARARWLKVDGAGRLSLDSLAEAIAEKPAIVSLQWANNETGVIQPIHEAARLCAAAGVVLHCDGVQWVGKEETRLSADGPAAPLLTLSPHKFHGLKGVGCLVIRPGVRLRPQMPGHQELGRRAGTENVPGILAAGAAADEARTWLSDPSFRAQQGVLRDRFENAIVAGCPGAVVNGAGAPRLWNTSNIGFPRLEAEAILLALSERGVCASAGAACASGSLDPSPVLRAMGIAPEVAHGSVRFSLSRQTTREEIDRAVEIAIRCVNSLRASTSAAIDPGS